MEANSRSGIRHALLQKKLDFLDELIDTLKREKEEAGDDDLPQDIEEAKQIQQAARESYSRGEFQTAWLQAVRAEYCILFLGRTELESWNRLLASISDTWQS